MFRFLNVATYLLLTLLWGAILALYLRQRHAAERSDRLVAVLMGVLALDAVRTVVESFYFGLVWGAQYGVLNHVLEPLSRPVPLTIVKWLNIAVAVTVLVRLIRVWIPSRLAERQMAAEDAERFRVAFDTISDAVSIVRLDNGKNVAVNPGYCRLSGYTEAECVGRSSMELGLWVEPAGRDKLFEGLRDHGSVRDLETKFRRRDGQVFEALCTCTAFTSGGVRYFLNVARDISEQRRAERTRAATYRIAAAASSAASVESLIAEVHRIIGELMPVPNFYIALHDAATDTLTFPYYADEHDAPPEGPQPMGKGLTEEVLRTGAPLLLNDETHFGALVARGEVRPVGKFAKSWVGVPLKLGTRSVGVLAAQIYEGAARYGDRERELLEFVSTQVAAAVDKKRAELALRKSGERFRALIEQTSDGICLVGTDERLRYASPATLRMLGHDPGVVLEGVECVVQPEDLKAFRARFAEAVQRPGAPLVVQFRARRKDGSSAPMEGVLTNLLGESSVEGIVLNLRDLTLRKRMEAQLMMADRMASVGLLAAGVAHEINNPLAYVIGNLELLTDGATPPQAEAITAAREGAERVRQIVRDLRAFSRSDDGSAAPVDVTRVVDSAVKMAHHELRAKAHLVRDDAPGLGPVLASEGRLAQVLINLLVNAAQAMPQRPVDQNVVRIATRADGPHVLIEVADNGSGMRPEERARLFEPFFTTKPSGVGTGLGLYICQQIVGAMGGSIEAQSELGKGTTFTLRLPAAAPEKRTARVLAIDDEPQIGALLKQALKAHDVSTSTSALDAIERIRGGERYEVILCDVMMPEMTGLDLHDALSREFPDQARRMVFITGGTFPGAERPGLTWLQKPFAVADIRELVARRLQEC